jgi:hypothetical protein
MNVLLNVDEANAVITRVTSNALDEVTLSEAAREAIREWRKNRTIGTRELDEFTLALNEAVGNYIDERTTRRLRLRGGLFVSETEVRG